MSSRQPTFSNTIHLRDFTDNVTSDPTKQNAPNHIVIESDINIFEEGHFCSPDIIVEPINTRIHAYVPQADRHLYAPNVFIYVIGRFTTARIADDNSFEVTIQAFSLMRHPGDAEDSNKYYKYFPEQWCPMVTIIGSVAHNEDTWDETEPRCFNLYTSVYDASKAAPSNFCVTCFLEQSKRWQNFKTASPDSLFSVTAKIAGRTKSKNLALRVLDLVYLPRTASTASTPSSTTTASKRANRWSNRADSTTPSKKPRVSLDQDAGTDSTHAPPITNEDGDQLQSPSALVPVVTAPSTPTPIAGDHDTTPLSFLRNQATA